MPPSHPVGNSNKPTGRDIAESQAYPVTTPLTAQQIPSPARGASKEIIRDCARFNGFDTQPSTGGPEVEGTASALFLRGKPVDEMACLSATTGGCRLSKPPQGSPNRSPTDFKPHANHLWLSQVTYRHRTWYLNRMPIDM